MAPTPTDSMTQLATDILIVGGGTGAVAAALAIAEMGQRCTLVSAETWIGGQLTSQAVPPDENQWIETVGGTRRYQIFRTRCRDWYRANRPLTPAAKKDPLLNPGNGWVSRLCIEPRIAHIVLEEMLAPHVAAGRIRIITGMRPTRAETDDDRITAVRFDLIDAAAAAGGPGHLTIEAKFVLDATELGDVYALANAEHMVGAEGINTFGELHGNPAGDDPMDQQAFSWCFALEHRPGENHTIPRPAQYDFWRSYVPDMQPPWCGPLFSWTVPTHNEAGCRTFPFLPCPEECPDKVWDMWRYRRITDQSLYTDPALHPDVCLVNWVQMDYWLRPLLNVSPDEAEKALKESRELSESLVYWLQTEAPRSDGGAGFAGLKLRGEELGTTDGFAMAPYIREPRRLVARTIVTEAHIGTEQRRQEGRPGQELSPLGLAELFEDSVGIGHYTLDLHPSTSGRNSVYVPAAPFRIPLGSLIPVRVRNLIAAGKGIGVTHITNGCYRMHHTEWNIGESAGELAAWCIVNNLEPTQVHESKPHLTNFQSHIHSTGIRTTWPWEPNQ